MHIDNTLRRPDPVVLFEPRTLDKFPVEDVNMPLDPGEIDLPLVARFWRDILPRNLLNRMPRDVNLDAPAFRLLLGIVQVAVNMNCRSQTLDVPAVDASSTISIGSYQE